jgi:two-component system LytT family response regulator
MTPVRALVTDDEKPARERLRRLIERDRRVELVGCSASGADAIRAVRDAARSGEPVNLLFLDVQMPELDGFGVVAALLEEFGPHIPVVVFVTAHDEYALQAFEARALDYLMKPFSDERFEASLDRAVAQIRAGHAEATLAEMQALLASAPGLGPSARADGVGRTRPSPVDRIVLKGANRVRLLLVQQIVWIEAAGMYVRLHMRDGGVHLHRSLIGHLEAALDTRRFVRVHRSAIVNLDVIDELRADAHGDYTVVLKDRTSVRLGRRYRERLQRRLGQQI